MPVSLTADLWVQLSDVQRDVNASTTYRSDPDLYGRPEFWAVADGAGDCEDYALAKLRRLVELGWPRQDLRLATCWCEDGGYHAVLTVDTDRGVYVLDNRQDSVVPWSRLPYRWHLREVPGHSAWETIPA